jgi:hypothetical protein
MEPGSDLQPLYSTSAHRLAVLGLFLLLWRTLAVAMQKQMKKKKKKKDKKPVVGSTQESAS